MVTVLDIANAAIAGVESAIEDAIITFTLTENVVGTVFDDATGTYPITPVARGTAKGVIETERPIADLFPDFVAGKSDQLIFLVGYDTPPDETFTLTRGSETFKVVQTQDLLGTGNVGYVVVR